jgi:hypothetical protein
MKKITLLALLCVFYVTARAGFSTVSLTGFTADIVSNGSVSAGSSISSFMTEGFDSAGYALVSQDYNFGGYTPSYYLPTGGAVTSGITSGLGFQLADYSSNNALRLKNSGDTGTLYFATSRTAGALYLCGLSGSGSSGFTAVVNFSDGTSETFSSLSYPDWYSSGASVQGIGRVSVTDNHTEGSSFAPSLFEIQLSIDPSNYSKLITSVNVSKTTSSGIMAIMAISAEDICSGSPSAGAVAADVTTGCSTFTANLSLPSSTSAAGISYQWQSSPDSLTWTDVSGATSATYAANVTDTVYYRAYVTCTISSLSDTSAGIALMVTSAAPAVATLPYYQSFESWIGTCYSYDRPSVSWLNSPSTGNNSWRRDDQGSDASWFGTFGGAYSPVSTAGAHSARFHSYEASYGSVGNMDLYVNLSSTGTKQIIFDYNNENTDGGSDVLNVELSEDGGATFTTLASYGEVSGWVTETISTTSVAANAILRFSATSDFGLTDIGVDNLSVSVLSGCTGTPTAGTISASTTTGCSAYSSTISVDTPIYMTGITYQWQSSADSVTWTDISGATGTSYTVSSVTANTYYRVYVVCTTSGGADTSAPVALYFTAPAASFASLPYFEDFESWIAGCYSFDRPGTNWLTSPPTGNNSWRRDDQGSDASWSAISLGAYSPVSTSGSHSARFHTYEASYGSVGNMDLYIDLSTPGTKQISFDYNNDNSDFGSDVLNVMLSEDSGVTFTTLASYGEVSGWVNELINTTSVSAHAIIRFSATSDFGNTDIGVDSLNISVLSSCTGTPVAGTISATSTTGCTAYSSTLSVDAPISLTGIGYQWQSSADGISWTSIAGATGTTYTDASVTANTYFRAYVTCSAGGSDTTTSLELTYTAPAPVYASVPYFEDFENWIAGCYSYDRPDSNWLTNPATGNNSWRRDDQGSDASWDGSDFGAYTPVSTSGSHSARFHTYEADYGSVGNIDLYIDLSAAGTKQIAFDYNNDNSDFGSDVLNVMLSEDSGATFTTLASYGEVSGWVPEVLTTTSTSAHAIIRFSATSDFGNTDIGIDSLYISIPTSSVTPCSAPVVVTATSVTATSATVSWDGVGAVAGYQYVINTTAADPTGAGTATTDTFVNVTGLTDTTVYYAHVRTACTTGDSSAWVTISFTTTATPVAPCDTPLAGTVTSITDSSAVASWDGVSGSGGYQYVVNTTAADPSSAGTATVDTFINIDSLAAGTTYYVHVRTACTSGDSSSWITLTFTTLSAPPACGIASGLAAEVTDSSATVSWSVVTGATGYQYVIDNNPAAPVVPGTFTTGTSYTDTGLTCATTYYLHVRTDCSTDSASWVTISFVTDSCTHVGVATVNINNFDVQAFPNPARERVSVNVTGVVNGNAFVQLTDVTGKVITLIPVIANKADVDMSNLATGIYFLNYSDSVNRRTIKISKQ